MSTDQNIFILKSKNLLPQPSRRLFEPHQPNMMFPELPPGDKPLLPLAATALAGLTAGGALYITLVEAPARKALPPSQQLKHWRTTFPRAMGVFKPAGIALVPTLCATAYVTEKSAFYAAAVPFALMAPFTKLTIADINARLLGMGEDEAQAEDGKEVVELVETWRQRHAVRTCLTATGFAISLYAISTLRAD